MFLAQPSLAHPSEHGLMKSDKFTSSRQLPLYSTSHKQYDEQYSENMMESSHGHAALTQSYPQKYDSIEGTSIPYSERHQAEDDESSSESFDASVAQRHQSEDGSQHGYELESPLQAYQKYNNQEPSASQTTYVRPYEHASEPLGQAYIPAESYDYQRVPEMYAKPEYSDYGLFARSAPQEQTHHYSTTQQFPSQSNIKSVYPGQLPEQARPLQLQPTPQQQVYEFPDMTSMVNSCQEAVGPMVEMTFVDSKVCRICSKRITRDMSRHLRTHQKEKRFVCLFPKHTCGNKSSQFNRRYDFKKHLLNKHFVYDDPEIVKSHTLRDKVFHWGTCLCGQRFLADNWMNNHILTKDKAQQCPLLKSSD